MSIQLQYYDTVAHGYTGILTLASGVLVTDGSGVPSFSTTLPAVAGTNLTGTAAGLTAGNVTTNANLTGAVTSSGNAATIAGLAQTWTDSAVYNFNAATLPAIVTTVSLAGKLALHIGGVDGDTVTSGKGSVQIVIDSFRGASGGRSGNCGQITMRHAGGTAATPSAIPSGDAMLKLSGGGYGTTTWFETSSSLQAASSEAWTDTAQGSLWKLFGTAKGTTTLTQIAQFSPDSGGFILGTNTNDSASAGMIGEYISGSASIVSMTTATPVTITSVSLTAGDWDVEGTLQYNAAAGTLMTDAKAGINTTTNVLPTAITAGGYVAIDAPAAAGVGHTLQTGHQRVSIAATTTVYLVGQATFTVSTMTGSGFIRARRAR
jgi:hypothetical protein